MSNDIHSYIIATISSNLKRATDYLIDFAVQARKMILLFKDHSFTNRNGKISLQPCEGEYITEILPEGYLTGSLMLLRPLDKSIISNKELLKNYDSLFRTTHFQFIHSTYFGPKGLTKSTVFHESMAEAIPRDETAVPKNFSAQIMKIAL